MEVICRRTTDPLNKIKRMLKNRAAELNPKVKSLKNSSLAVDEITLKTQSRKRKIEADASSECSLMKKSKLDHRQVILAKLVKHKWATPFLHPLDPDAAGDYFRVVKHPMDFATIKRKLHQNKYPVDDDDEEFATDVRLIFSNATLYHPSNNWVHMYATKLSRLFDLLWVDVKPKLSKVSIIDHNKGNESTCNAKEIVEPGCSLGQAARVAQLKLRFADTILRAKTKTTGNLVSVSSVDNKAREVASQMKRQREQERETARASLQQLERSITLDNLGAMRELGALMRCNHGNEIYDGSWMQSKSGTRKSPLERLGIFIKPEYRLGYEDDDDLFIQGSQLEEGEILV